MQSIQHEPLFFPRLAALAAAAWIALCPTAYAQPALEKRVLVLQSLHPGEEWTEDAQWGIARAFGEDPAAIAVFTEYLDAHRFPPRAGNEAMAAFLRAKYGSERLDAVVCAGPEALEFVMERGESLFPGVQTAFCGAPPETARRAASMEGFTGVAEDMDLTGLLELAFELHPDARTALVVSAGAGPRLDAKMAGARARLKDRVSLIHFKDWTLAELFDRLVSLPPGTLVVPVSYFRDRTGMRLSDEYGMGLIAGYSGKPVYTPLRQFIGNGAVGGLVADGARQGYEAGLAARRLIRGVPADEIPIRTDIPNTRLFDHRLLIRYGIDVDRIPRPAVFVNEPTTFYHKYRNEIRMAGAAAAAFVATLTGLLLFNIFMRKRAERGLARQIRLLQDVIDAIPHPVFYEDVHGRHRGCNRAFESMIGRPKGDILGKTIGQWAPPEFARAHGEHNRRLLESPGVLCYEIRIENPEGGIVEAVVHMATHHDEKGNTAGLAGVAVDVTARNRMEAELRRSRETLEKRVIERTADLERANRRLRDEIAERMRVQSEILAIGDRERRRIGQDLHDGLCQHLLGIQCMCDALRQQMRADGIEGSESIHTIARLIGEAIAQTRTLARGLAPVDLEAGGIAAAFDDLASTVRGMFRVRCTCARSGDFSIEPPERALHAFRIAQEAVNNAIRHGGATEIVLSLTRENGCSLIEIRDNGKGFEEGALPHTQRGMGLRIMEYRAKMIGGGLEIRSKAGKGASVICSIPIGRESGGGTPRPASV